MRFTDKDRIKIFKKNRFIAASAVTLKDCICLTAHVSSNVLM
ncbi:hypothetical Protein YC6258_00791 [Gynuella sunshinyii YC6258]|uniref:Uncharacterized protein n=1 Tax=Gynuella sunshinyii YC6258 TaxID=1445510 RepID=A0A0C5VFA7_9GAMM|nr:hypothetical Protein YC6258_00791 [Gynuella sunshinyii YC6258]